MTYEQLTVGQNKLAEIKEVEKFIRILQNGYSNSIIGYNYPGNGETVPYRLDGELREMVINVLQLKLKTLETEFGNI